MPKNQDDFIMSILSTALCMLLEAILYMLLEALAWLETRFGKRNGRIIGGACVFALVAAVAMLFSGPGEGVKNATKLTTASPVKSTKAGEGVKNATKLTTASPVKSTKGGEKPSVMKNLHGVWRGDNPKDVIRFDMESSPYSDEGTFIGYLEGNLCIPIIDLNIKVIHYDKKSIHFYIVGFEGLGIGGVNLDYKKQFEYTAEVSGDRLVFFKPDENKSFVYSRVKNVRVPTSTGECL